MSTLHTATLHFRHTHPPIQENQKTQTKRLYHRRAVSSTKGLHYFSRCLVSTPLTRDLIVIFLFRIFYGK